MAPHKIFFYSGLFFLLGILLKSLGLGYEILFIFLAGFLASLFVGLIYREKKFFVLSFLFGFILVGTFLYQIDDNQFQKANLPTEQAEFKGKIVSNPVVVEGRQRFHLSLLGDNSGKIAVYTSPYPEYNYGQVLKMKGNIEKAGSGSYGEYLKSQYLNGSVYFPKTKEIVERKSSFKGFLLSISEVARDTYKKFLSPKYSAFLGGITFGGYEGMTEKFRSVLQKSGTTHLVALSGFHVTVILTVLMSFFLGFFSRKTSLILTFLALAVFIIITGARANIIRAGIMGGLAALAEQAGRIYDPKNSAMLAAILIVGFSPKSLVFDVGFQLSFLALLGILYLRPVLRKTLKMSKNPGFLSWRDNFLTTTSAQLAVAPVLIFNFGEFSLVSLIANIAVLEFIPLIMGLGFTLFFIGSFFYLPAVILSWFISALLFIEIGIIEFFGNLDLVSAFSMGWAGFSVYYLILISLVYYFFEDIKHERV